MVWREFTWLMAASYFGPFVGCLFRDVVSSSECTITWNVTMINELWARMDVQGSGHCLICCLKPATAWTV
jgi:hypothetical protein